MKTYQLMALDCRKEENLKTINKALLKIKPLSRYEDEERVPLEKVETYVEKVQRKYDIRVQYMKFSTADDESRWYNISVMTRKSHEWLGSIHGYTLYEVWAKLALQLFIWIKEERVKEFSVEEE